MAESYAGARRRAESGAPARLRATEDVQAVLRRGRTCGGTHVVVKALRRHDGEAARVAVVAGRKVGGAVARNRIKRRLRAAVRSVALAQGTDVVLIGRSSALTAPFSALVAELDGCRGGTS